MEFACEYVSSAGCRSPIVVAVKAARPLPHETTGRRCGRLIAGNVISSDDAMFTLNMRVCGIATAPTQAGAIANAAPELLLPAPPHTRAPVAASLPYDLAIAEKLMDCINPVMCRVMVCVRPSLARMIGALAGSYGTVGAVVQSETDQRWMADRGVPAAVYTRDKMESPGDPLAFDNVIIDRTFHGRRFAERFPSSLFFGLHERLGEAAVFSALCKSDIEMEFDNLALEVRCEGRTPLDLRLLGQKYEGLKYVAQTLSIA